MSNPLNRLRTRHRWVAPHPDHRLIQELVTIRDRRQSDAEVTR